MNFEFQQVCLAAVYPSFALLYWSRPTPRLPAPTPQTIAWTYTAEWNCTSDSNYRTCVCDSSTQIALPLEYLKEVYHVRVIAKSNVENIPNTLMSSLSFYAECNVWMPWLQEGALSCRCIFDGLYLSCCCNERTVAQLVAHTGGDMRYEGMCVMRDRSAAHVVEATFAEPPFPLEHRNVVYILPCLLPANGALQHNVDEYMDRLDCSIVFLGVGTPGEYMVKSLLTGAQMLHSLKTLKRRFFCITYGAERVLFAQHSIRFTQSCLLSGNFLTYSGSHDPSDHCCVFNSDVTTQISSCKRTTAEGVFTNAPLGVHAGAKRKVLSSTLALQADVQLKTVGCDRVEQFNASKHLALLQMFFFPDKTDILLPSITRATCSVVHNACVLLELEGVNLQFNTTVTCICTQEGGLQVELHVTEIEPGLIKAEGFIGEVVATAVAAAVADKRSPPSTLSLMVLAQTNFGMTTTAVELLVPTRLMRLFGAGHRAVVGDRPARTPPFHDYPSRLYDSAIVLQPFATRVGTMSESMRLLNLLLMISEIASGYAPGQRESSSSSSSGLLSFVTGIASKASSKNAASPKLHVPPSALDNVFLRRSVEDAWSTGDVTTFNMRASSWKRRILSGMRHLTDAQYAKQLERALLLFDITGDIVDESSSLPVLELLVYASVSKYIDRRCKRLTQEVSLESFYQMTLPLFSKKLENGVAEGHMVDCLFLFAVCATIELRLCCANEAYIFLATGSDDGHTSSMQRAVKGLILPEGPDAQQDEEKLFIHLVSVDKKHLSLLHLLLRTEVHACMMLVIKEEDTEKVMSNKLYEMLSAGVSSPLGQRFCVMQGQPGPGEDTPAATLVADASSSAAPSAGKFIRYSTESLKSELVAAFGDLQDCMRLL